ncbi:hypothetical protein C8J56DRAFT_1085913 [Mycena floridula]|nr:hypothetical protein C8J56DRAFT_1085913 [Mycena floridula]
MMSKSIMDDFAQELIESIIDHLFDDLPSLLACSLVCRRWREPSLHRVFSRAVVRVDDKKKKKNILRFLQLLESTQDIFRPRTLLMQFDKDPRELTPASTFQRFREYRGQSFASVETLSLDGFSIPVNTDDFGYLQAQLAGFLSTMSAVVDLRMNWSTRDHSTSWHQFIKGKKRVDSSDVEIQNLVPKIKALSLHGEGTLAIASFLSSINAVAQIERLGIDYRGIGHMGSLFDNLGLSLVELRIRGIPGGTLARWNPSLVPQLQILMIGIHNRTTFCEACDLVMKFVQRDGHGSTWPLRRLILQVGYEWTDGAERARQLFERLDRSLAGVQALRQVVLRVLKYRDELNHWAKNADMGNLLPLCRAKHMDLRKQISTGERDTSYMGLLDTQDYAQRMRAAAREEAEDARAGHHKSRLFTQAGGRYSKSIRGHAREKAKFPTKFSRNHAVDKPEASLSRSHKPYCAICEDLSSGQSIFASAVDDHVAFPKAGNDP